MSAVKSAQRRLCFALFSRMRRLAIGSVALALAAGGQAAMAQMMERMNAQANVAATPAAAAAPATPNMDCTLIVPHDPLTAKGLATPWQLKATDPANGPCHEYNTAQSAFVQAAVIDPATGAISIYNPLVIDAGATPAVAPVVPTLPANAIVAIWTGFNANNLTLQPTPSGSDNLEDNNCVNGTPGSVFGQFSYCNAVAFFKAANAAIANGQLKIPALATAKDGGQCPSTRNFFVVDQDQSDNVTTSYLVTPKGKIAQNTQANIAALKGAMLLSNPSDNGLVAKFMDAALGCTPAMAPDLADPGKMVPALPLNELQSRLYEQAPVALIPGGDPMTLVNTNENLTKTNLYRAGTDQPRADSYHDISTSRYCREMLRIAPGRLFNSTTRGLLSNFTSPDAGAANSLFTFLAQRFVASYTNLNCQTLIGQADPITLTTSAAGVVTDAKLNTSQLNETLHDIAASKANDYAEDSLARSQQATE